MQPISGTTSALEELTASFLGQTDAQAADQLLNRLAREFADAYDAGTEPEVLSVMMMVYGWLRDVASEDNKSDRD